MGGCEGKRRLVDGDHEGDGDEYGHVVKEFKSMSFAAPYRGTERERKRRREKNKSREIEESTVD